MTNHPSDITATVYSRPGCVKCRATHRKLKSMGIPVDIVQIDDHPEKIAYMKFQGWAELPLVQIRVPREGEVHYWAGMSQDNLDALDYLTRAGRAT